MTRLIWFIAALVVALIGLDLLIHDALGWTGWLLAGVGLGIGTGVVGSLVHDALAGPRERLP